MWEEDYFGSLTLLPGTLAELGATAGLEHVSLEEEDRDEWDLTSVVYMIDSTLSILDSLEENGFYRFLNKLSEIAREMKSVLALARKWKVVEVTGQIEHTLRPIHRMVSCFGPKKVYWTLLNTKDFLEDVGGYDWGGEDCLEHLTMLHEHLEELRPGSRLSFLRSLRELLVAQCEPLVWLASHSLIEKKLGRQNVFARLILIKIDLEIALADGEFLEGMQEMLEELDHLQAIDLHE